MFRPTRAVFALFALVATMPPAAMATPPCFSDPFRTVWRPDGTAVTSPSAVPLELIVVPDPRGAARVFWNDFRDPNKVSVYSRYVTSEAWEQTTECRVSLSTGNEAQSSFARAPEQSLLTVWSDDRDDDGDIYVQRSSFGCGRWPSFVPEGIPVCTGPGRQSQPSVAVDGKEGFYVAWVDQRIGSTTGSDIYIQRFHDYGQVWEGWPINGAPLCASPGEQFDPVVVADGSVGALVFFLDATKPADLDLFMARISETGVVPAGWTNGRAVTTSTADPGGPIVLPVATGGAFVAWLEVTLGGANPEMGIRLTRVTGQGEAAPGWSLDGVSVGAVAGTTGAPTLAGDGESGVFVG
ncbi:MAG: hypothetical protein AAB011_12475, partial [Candidatus Eisenbacteria bacterium]